MIRSVFLYTALVIFALTSCTSDTEAKISNDETFIFGVSYGFCLDNCTHLFSYYDDQVYRDEVNRLDLENLRFSTESESELVPIASKIRTAFPQLLLDSNEERYGCPDCADQGTLFLQISTETETRNWYLDPRPDTDWPKELTDYVQLLNSQLSDIIVF